MNLFAHFNIRIIILNKSDYLSLVVLFFGGVQKVQDVNHMMLTKRQLQEWCRWCRDGAGYLHRLHLCKHNVRCREVQEVQAHVRCRVGSLQYIAEGKYRVVTEWAVGHSCRLFSSGSAKLRIRKSE